MESFLSSLEAIGGGDVPEDVLGGMRQATLASWEQQARLLVHIADAPSHGSNLHQLAEKWDDYFEPGTEPHGLTYEPLLTNLVEQKINYVFLRIHPVTDRMVSAFSDVYLQAMANVTLHTENVFCSDKKKDVYAMNQDKQKPSSELMFEEFNLGTSYSELRRMITGAASSSISCAASRLMASSADRGGKGNTNSTSKTSYNPVKHSSESVTRGEHTVDDKEVVPPVKVETLRPMWHEQAWFDETLVVDGFWPEVLVHGAETLRNMMAADANIRVGEAELVISARSKPFGHGSFRAARYARTESSTNRFVVKSYIEGGVGIAQQVEDMRMQALCKAFALEFNGLVGQQPSLDFVVTTVLQSEPGTTLEGDYISLEPFIEGSYVKFNNNSGWVKADDEGDDESSNQINHAAQAFSHFTFERSWGSFLAVDLQGLGRVLTDPAIHTSDPDRFKLCDCNMNSDGFKFFFATHDCNEVCRELKLETNREMIKSGTLKFRESWPTMKTTVCCANKLCRDILQLASAHKSDNFLGHYWCDKCWPQLEDYTVQWVCMGGTASTDHSYNVSKFFYESQGLGTPRKCPEHQEKASKTASLGASGGSLFAKTKTTTDVTMMHGRGW